MKSFAMLWTRRALAFLLLAQLFAANAADYPTKPITVVIPAGTGSGPDVIARKLAELLQSSLGTPVIVDNRPGAGGISGTEFAAKAKPDGYTLYLGTNAALCINPALYSKLPYDAGRSFVPLSMATRGSPVLLIDPNLPIHSLGEFVKYAKDHPNRLSYASSGTGSTSHLAGELLKHVTGIQMLHVPYKEETRGITDVIAGEVQATVAFGAVAVGHVRTGRLRAIAIAGPRRNPLLPDVPTSAEQGFADFELSGWIGFFAPAGTPAEIIARLEKAFIAAETAPDYADWIRSLGSEPVASKSSDFGAAIKLDTQRWAAIVRNADAHLD